MASERTNITELATAAGMVLGSASHDVEYLNALEVPGIDESVWRPWLEPAAESWHRYHGILRAAMANGAAFRHAVLRDRDPDSIEWRGGAKATWVSDAPVDLLVNDVYQVSAKYDSKCLLNRAPAAVFDEILRPTRSRYPDWYSTTAPDAHDRLYDELVAALAREAVATLDLPTSPSGLRTPDRQRLKYGMKPWERRLPASVQAAYSALSAEVSLETARRWRQALDAAPESVVVAMLAQMIRVCGTRYWLLGQAQDRPVRSKVNDLTSWRKRFALKAFDVTARPELGQPQVDWTATVADRDGRRYVVDGFCEVRWSHGKFSGQPECKVQLRTPVWALPGYEPVGDAQPNLGL